MRPHIVATFVFGLLSLGSSTVATVKAEQQLRMLSHRDRLYDATGFERTVFVVGHPGRLLRSRDGGSTFESMSVAKHDEALFSIAFNAKGEGAVVGRSGFVLLTSDKGETWSSTVVQLDGEKPSLFSVDVLDDGSIVAVGNFGVIVRSSDHGKTWTRSTYSSAKPAESPEQAKLCAAAGSAEADNEGAIDEARLTDVAFVDSEHGFAVGEFGLIVHTDDGGKTFKRQNSCTDRTLYSVSVIDATRALAVGSDGAVVETKDGGTIWSVVPTNTTEHLFGVFADAQRTVVVGAVGTLLVRDADGPLTPVDTGVHSWLSSAWLDAKGQGVIVGGRAYVLGTRDGAKTQQRISGE
jgi:photosystem II stability/assembly factor-like uncharacterized protein